MKKYKIYYLSSSDKPNDVRYIGYTGRKLNVRLKEHINESYHRNSHNNKTYKEHWIQKCILLGLNVLINILEDDINELEIEQKEIDYIDKYKKLGVKLLNLTGGGDGQKKMSQETKNKISKSKIGIQMSQETKEKIRKKSYERKHTEEECIKMSKSISGKNAGKKLSYDEINHLRKISKTKISVCQFSKEGNFIQKFDSFKNAMKMTNIDSYSISCCCKGKRYKSAGGYIWKYDNHNYENIQPYDKCRVVREILQFSLTGEFLNEWKNASQANRATNICNSNIIACCKGRYKSSGGYIWKYKNIQIEKILFKKIKSKPVRQYTFDNVFVNQYKSIGEAALATNCRRNHISGCCYFKNRSAGGYIWRFIT